MNLRHIKLYAQQWKHNVRLRRTMRQTIKRARIANDACMEHHARIVLDLIPPRWNPPNSDETEMMKSMVDVARHMGEMEKDYRRKQLEVYRHMTEPLIDQWNAKATAEHEADKAAKAKP